MIINNIKKLAIAILDGELINDQMLRKSKIHKHLRGGYRTLNFQNLIVEDVDLATYTIDLDERFWHHSRKLANCVLNELQAIKTKEKTDWSLKSPKQDRIDFVIGNTMKYLYIKSDSKEYNFFYFVTDVLIALLKSHPAQNGNKRFAAAFLKIFLYQHGYYLDWLKNNKTEEIIANFAVKLQNKEKVLKGDEKLQIRYKIYQWIVENTVIALNFRERENFVEFFSKKSINNSIENIKKEADWKEFVDSMIRLADI